MFMGAAEAEQVPGAPAAAAQPALSCLGSTVWISPLGAIFRENH